MDMYVWPGLHSWFSFPGPGSSVYTFCLVYIVWRPALRVEESSFQMCSTWRRSSLWPVLPPTPHSVSVATGHINSFSHKYYFRMGFINLLMTHISLWRSSSHWRDGTVEWSRKNISNLKCQTLGLGKNSALLWQEIITKPFETLIRHINTERRACLCIMN